MCHKHSGMAMDEPIPFCYTWNFNEHVILRVFSNM
jgi:hypothetical protein